MKVSIIGVGRVGSSIGLLLVGRHLVDELVLVGRTRASARGEALDLLHATAFGRITHVRAGEVNDTDGSDVLVICLASSGVARPRELGLESNFRAIEQILPALFRASPDSVVVIATNPVDAMTTLVSNNGGWPADRVIGTGTLLDTMRLRVLLSQRFGMAPSDLRAYVLGEHGDSQFVAFSSASAGGGRLKIDGQTLCDIEAAVRQAGHDITRLKGYSNHGIALATAEIIEAILCDSHGVMPLSTRLDGFCGIDDICLSVPLVVGRSGVIQRIEIDLSAEEKAAFRRCAETVRSMVSSVIPLTERLPRPAIESLQRALSADYCI